MMKLWLFTLIHSVTAFAQSPNISVHTHNNPDSVTARQLQMRFPIAPPACSVSVRK